MAIKDLKAKLTHDASQGIGLTLSGELEKNISSHSLRLSLWGKFHDSSSQTGYGNASWDFNISGRLTDDNFLLTSNYDYPYLASALYTASTGRGNFRLSSFSNIGTNVGWGEPPKPNSKSYMRVIIDEVHYDDIDADWYNSDSRLIINQINLQPTFSNTIEYRNSLAQLKLKEAGIDIAKLSSQISTSLQKLGYRPYEDETISEDAVATIKRPDKFEKSKVDKIINFNPSIDTLEIDSDSLRIDKSATFAAGKNKRKIWKLAKKDFDFLFDQKKGGLYFNKNGADKGFGEGGIIAILKGAPDLTAGNLEFISGT